MKSYYPKEELKSVFDDYYEIKKIENPNEEKNFKIKMLCFVLLLCIIYPVLNF